MPSEGRLKKNTEQLKEGLKSSILGPQNLGSGGPGPLGPPLDPLVQRQIKMGCIELCECVHTAQRQIALQIPIGFCANLLVWVSVCVGVR